jgi:nucleotide-binding universal stress UspA family protein
MARTFNAGVTLLHVLDLGAEGEHVQRVDPLDWRIRKAEAGAYLSKVADRLHKANLQTERVILEGEPAQHIVEFARNQDVDLILLNSHGKSGLSRWNVSSVVHKVIQLANRSIMIARAYKAVVTDLGELHYQRLLLPLDGSQRAEIVLSPATTLARFHEAQILVVHALHQPQMLHRVPPTPEEMELVDRLVECERQAARKYLEQLQSRLGVDFETRLLVADDIAGSLQDLVENENVDLVLLSAHGYTGKTRWPYGSVATNFLEYGSTPLLVVQDLAPEEVKPTQAEVAATEHKGH